VSNTTAKVQTAACAETSLGVTFTVTPAALLERAPSSAAAAGNILRKSKVANSSLLSVFTVDLSRGIAQ
jgi:hypothetical protein